MVSGVIYANMAFVLRTRKMDKPLIRTGLSIFFGGASGVVGIFQKSSHINGFGLVTSDNYPLCGEENR